MAVHKRNKVWYVYYYVKVSGRHKKKGVAVGSRKDVAEALDKKYREMIKAGKNPMQEQAEKNAVTKTVKPASNVPKGISLEKFKPLFIELHGKLLSKKMQESYKTSFGHLLQVFGKEQLEDISPMKAQAYMLQRLHNDVCNTTVIKEMRCLTKALSMASEWGYIKQNPLKGIKLPPERIRYLTKDEYERLLEVSPQYLHEIIVFAVGTGMRKSEIFNLTWDDVTFSQTSKYGQITIWGKGDKLRYLSMNKTVYDLLIRLYRVKKGVYVFPSPKTGERIIDVKKAFRTALKDSGIDNFRFHDLRHTFASWLVMKGVDLYTVQKLLGHTNVRTTQRYAHLSPGYLESEIGKLDEFLSPENESIEEVFELFESQAV